MGFIDSMRSQGHAVESVCRVLREQGCQVAARTYRDWARADRPVAARTIGDALVVNQVRELAWTVDHQGVRRMTPEGLYPEHDLFIQLMKLKNTLRHLRGEELITHLGAEYYD